MLKAPKNTFEELYSNVSFMTLTLKIIHIPCKQFLVGTIFSLQNNTHQLQYITAQKEACIYSWNRGYSSGKEDAINVVSRVPFSSIILQTRQTFVPQISTKLTLNNQDGQTALQVTGKVCVFDFGVNCPFKQGTVPLKDTFFESDQETHMMV